jgi:polygalacturonase
MNIDVTGHGVRGDGVTLNTPALQTLIDRCGESGGTLQFPAGRYLTGGLELRSHVHLHLHAGAVLLGSTNLADYRLVDPPPVRFAEDFQGVRALLYAHGCRGIRLSGGGTIDGQGPRIARPADVRASLPRNIWFALCDDVVVEGLRLRHAGFWMQHYLKCTGLRLHGLDVYNHGSCNNDGCDIDCCRDVIISRCRIDSHDDAICLKSNNDRPTENVLISQCITSTHCNHFKTGTESNGGFRNITVQQLQCVPSVVRESDPNTGGADWRGACGIALGCVDGGMLENISVQHVQMDQVRVPLFIKLGDRGRPIAGTQQRLPAQFARGIHLSQFIARGASRTGGYVMGLPESPVCDVRITDCDLEFEGGGTDADAQANPPLHREVYPSCDAFGVHSAYGLFLRDARGVVLRNLNFRTLRPDARPALRWQRVRDLRLEQVSDQSGS